MADVPASSGRRFHASGSGELRHNSIHSRNSNHSSSHPNSDDDEERQQQRQQSPMMCLQKPPFTPGSEAPMVAVQVVDRLRWWRTQRMREQPIPLHHYVFRGNYTNYSSFGTRPLAPGLSRLLQKARTVRMQHLQRQQLRQRGTSVTCSVVDEAEHRLEQQQQEEQLLRAESDLLDNKRVSCMPAAASASAAVPLASLPSSPIHAVAVAEDHDATSPTAASPSDAAASVTAVPPLSVTAVDVSLTSTSLNLPSCPTEEEAQAAERLLQLYRPRAASMPVRSRRQRRVAGYGGNCVGLPPLGNTAAAAAGASPGVEERASQSIHMTRVPTSDDMTEVGGAAGAAGSAVVLHHEPRLVIYERALNPRAALRTARVSSNALEGLRDAAAENSAEVFALANLPLSDFERFFYQQQLRDGRHDDTLPLSSAAATHTSDANSTNHVRCCDGSNAPRTSAAFPSAPLGEEGNDYPPGYGVVNREDALYFGSPMTVTSPVFSPFTQTPLQSTSAAAVEAAGRHVDQHASQQTCCSSAADRLHIVAGRVARRHQQWASLRAVSMPCLPRVYKGGCPQLQSPTAETKRRISCRARQRGSHRSLLPSALHSTNRPQDDAHLCQRVDDLQDVYAFNPIFDAIGKGAFSKVYAAVPILRGRDGMRRFRTLDDHVGAAVTTTTTATTATTDNNAAGASQQSREGKITTAVSMSASSAVPAASLLSSRSATPRSSPPVASDFHADAVKGTGATPAAEAAAPRRLSLRSVPVVALKVIPRKARRKEQKVASADFPASPVQGQHPQLPSSSAQQGVTDVNNNNSVRRELVEIEREVSILRRLHHTGCSHFYEALRSPDAFVIAMRIYPGSMDARHYLSRYGPPSEARTALFLFQLVSTVHYLHTSFGLIHRDIKLENLLFSEVDSSVPNARISEVLGTAVHKGDSTAVQDDLAAAWPLSSSSAPPRDGETMDSAAATGHEVMRLLRVTLIDFGLARRTRTAGTSASLSRARGGGANARNPSFSVSIDSPCYLMPGFSAFTAPGAAAAAATGAAAATATGAAASAATAAAVTGGATSIISGTASYLRSPTVLAGSTLSPATPNVSASTQPPQAPFMPMPAMGGSGAAAGFAATRSSNNSCTAMSAMPPPLCPPHARRSSSTVVYGSAANLSVSRMGMPTPMPSTANMFTRFLDLDEDTEEEEESVANGAPTAGFAGSARACSEVVNGAYEASVTSPCTAGSFRRRGSRADFAEEQSAASSTDVSASETDSESAQHKEEEEEEADSGDEARNTRSKSASADEAEPAVALTSIAQMVSDPTALTATHFAQPPPPPPPPPLLLPSPHTPQRLSSDGSSQMVMGGVSNLSAANMPPSLLHRQPAPQQRCLARDDTETTLLLTPCGTEKYLPPEVLSWVLERGWTRRSTTVGLARAMDMYAIGIVAYVLLSGCFPFNASSRATLLQQQQRVPRCNSARWSGVSSEAIAFVQRLLEPNPLKRMTAKEALEHPFLLEARQLAEKLSLVPHGEGEEISRSTDADDIDAQQHSHLHLTNSNTSNNNSLRAHWSATGPRATPQPSFAAFADRVRGGDIAAAPTTTTLHSSVSGSFHRTSSLASLVKTGPQATLGGPGRSAASKSSTPEASFVGTTISTAAAAAAATAISPAPPRKDGEDGTFLHNADGASLDTFAAMSRDMLGTARPPLRVAAANAETPTKQRQQRPSSSVSPSSASPATAPVAKTAGNAAKAEPVASPKPSTVSASQTGTKGGGDDLFESLYNNIMFSD